MFDIGVLKLSNPLPVDYVHEYAGKKFKIPAKTVVDLPKVVAEDVAYHLAQRVCASKGLPNFGAEWEQVKDELLGRKQEVVEIVPEEIPDFELEAPAEETVEELSGTGILDDEAFVPEVKPKRAPKANK